jgi:hypothetical protein
MTDPHRHTVAAVAAWLAAGLLLAAWVEINTATSSPKAQALALAKTAASRI